MAEMILFWAAVGFLVRTVRVVRLRKQAATAKTDSVCAACMYAHIQHAANGTRAISCTYGGGVRPMKLDVLYCSDYVNRYAVLPARTVGFTLNPGRDAEASGETRRPNGLAGSLNGSSPASAKNGASRTQRFDDYVSGRLSRPGQDLQDDWRGSAQSVCSGGPPRPPSQPWQDRS